MFFFFIIILFYKGLFLIICSIVTIVCYTDNGRMYSNIDVASFDFNLFLTMISVALKLWLWKKGPRMAGLAALETHCIDELFEAVSRY